MAKLPQMAKQVYVGLSITHQSIELAVFSPKTLSVESSASVPLPEGLFDNQTDTIHDLIALKQYIAKALAELKSKPTVFHVSLPATLLRMVEMPKIDHSSLHLSLSSEAERYKTFDNTEAIVDFVQIPNPALSGNIQQLVLGAIRRDVMGSYLRIFKELKIKAASISLEPVNELRGLAASGVLDSLVQQIGVDARWGMILVEAGRVRFSLWQGDRLVEFRELLMDTHQFGHAQENDMVVDDLLEEMRRTTKNVIPVLWLTSNMPASMEKVLSQRLSIPVRNAPIGDSIGLTQPIKLSTLGVATTSLVPFPFALDLQLGLKKGGRSSIAESELAPIGGGTSASGDSDLDDAGNSFGIFIPIGIGVMVLCGLLTGVLFLMSMFSEKSLPDLQTKVDNINGELASLKETEKQLRGKVNLNEDLQEVLWHAKARTQSYVALTNQLKDNIPTDSVWIQNLNVTGQNDNSPLEITGRSLNHQAVIDFARSYDSVPYTSAILIDSIKEIKIGTRRVYEFKISGNLNLTSILTEIKSKKEESSRNSEKKPVEQPGKSGA